MRTIPMLLAASITFGASGADAAIDPKTLSAPITMEWVSARTRLLVSEGFRAPGASWTVIENRTGRLAVQFVEVTEGGKCRVELVGFPKFPNPQNAAFAQPRTFLSTEVSPGIPAFLQWNGSLPAVEIRCEEGLAKAIIVPPGSQAPQSSSD